MTAYWIAHVTITDPERYRGYTTLAPKAFEKYGARFLARGGEHEDLEGESFERHVLIEFPDLESARACYLSPEYQAAKERRDNACVAQICIVAGIGG